MPRASSKRHPAAQHSSDVLDEIADAAIDDDDEESAIGTVASTVKMKLKTFCRCPRLQDRIQALVKRMNRVVGEAYAFANFHVTRILNDPARPALPAIDRNFYYRCLVAVCDFKTRKGTLDASWQASIRAFDALRPAGSSKVPLDKDTQIIADLSITMATAAVNHLYVNLDRRLRSYVKWRHPELKTLVFSVSRLVAYPSLSLDKVLPLPAAGDARRPRVERARDVVAELRPLVAGLTARRCKKHAGRTLPLYLRMLRDIEDAKEGAGSSTMKKSGRPPRPFTLLPMKRGFTISYIPISSMTLCRLVRDWEGLKNDGRDLDHPALWKKYFHVKKVDGGPSSGRRFDNRIVTDACGVSILMAKQTALRCPSDDPPASPELRALVDAGARVVGVDPGFKDVVTAVSLDGDVSSYGSARYYEAAKFNVSRRRTDAWNDETSHLVAGLERPPSTADRMAVFVASYLEVLPELIEHRMSRGYRNMRFMRYVHREKAINAICDTVAPAGRSTIVGFGDWSGGNASPVSRRTCGPVEEIKHRLRMRKDVTILSVDEFRTSVTCSCCNRRLSNMVAVVTRKAKAPGQGVHSSRSKVHTVLHCRSSVDNGIDRCGATWNRDVNAARNILALTMRLVHGFRRPDVFCRSS